MFQNNSGNVLYVQWLGSTNPTLEACHLEARPLRLLLRILNSQAHEIKATTMEIRCILVIIFSCWP